MISSMTGYGRGEVTRGDITAIAEIRTVNSRYFEVAAKLPRTMTLRENEVKELIRSRFIRGKINVALSIVRENSAGVPLKINTATARTYYKLLNDLRKAVKLKEKVTLDHLMKFQDIIEISEFEKGDEDEWLLVKEALNIAIEEVAAMRLQEGNELEKDLKNRIHALNKSIDEIERIAKTRLPEERIKLEQRVRELSLDQSVVDNKRLELEFALLVDKLDVTEECVRFRSHNKFFLEAFKDVEPSGRKLNFLVQEMNREANTIGAKASSAEISHLVVGIKEELEKIREQLQNIE